MSKILISQLSIISTDSMTGNGHSENDEFGFL